MCPEKENIDRHFVTAWLILSIIRHLVSMLPLVRSAQLTSIAELGGTIGRPVSRHAWNPPAMSVARTNPISCRAAAAKLEA